jgi:hypothetical protein
MLTRYHRKIGNITSEDTDYQLDPYLFLRRALLHLFCVQADYKAPMVWSFDKWRRVTATCVSKNRRLKMPAVSNIRRIILTPVPCIFYYFVQWTNQKAQLIDRLSHFSYMFRHYCVILSGLAVSTLPSYTSIWHSEDRVLWYILVIKPTRCTNFSNLFLE